MLKQPPKLLQIAIMLFFFYSLNAQVNYDSLRSVATQTESDSVAMDAYYKISKDISHTQPDSGIYYAKQALSFAQAMNNFEGESSALSQIGFSYYKKNHIDSSLFYWEKSAFIKDSLGDEFNAALVWENIAVQKIFLGEYNQALGFLDKAKAVFIRLDSVPKYETLILNYGLLYDVKGDYDEGYKYYMQAFESAQKRDDKYVMGLAKNNLSVMYYFMEDFAQSIKYGRETLVHWAAPKFEIDRIEPHVNMAVSFERLGQIDSSIVYNQRGTEIAKRKGDQFSEAKFYTNLGALYFEDGKWDEAERYLLKAVKLKEQFSVREGTPSSYNKLASLYLRKNTFAKAKTFLDKAKEAAKQIQSLEDLKTNEQIKAEYLEATGNYKGALESYQNYVVLKDSLVNIETKKAIEKIKSAYELEKKEGEISMLKQENTITTLKNRNYLFTLISIALLLLTSLFALFYYIKNGRTQRENILILEDQKRELFELNESMKEQLDQAPSPNDWDQVKQNFLTLPGKEVRKIKLEHIEYIKSDGNGVYVHTSTDKYHVWIRLKGIHEILPEKHFVRCHKSYIVNLHKTNFTNSNYLVTEDGTQVPIGATYKERLHTDG